MMISMCRRSFACAPNEIHFVRNNFDPICLRRTDEQTNECKYTQRSDIVYCILEVELKSTPRMLVANRMRVVQRRRQTVN